MGMHYKDEKFTAVLEKYISMLGVEIFLKHLIELIISQERYITINSFFIDLIEEELKDEKAKNLEDW